MAGIVRAHAADPAVGGGPAVADELLRPAGDAGGPAAESWQAGRQYEQPAAAERGTFR